ncbi:MAG: MFS transporter, partial [Planctomycetes bacterium]|nr:MFS transporter [Planctomycetota bacterium]
MALYESQVLARHLDLAARRMKAEGTGFYTIASAGHEGNVVLGRLLEPTDPCFLHYRSAALMVERARHRCGGTPVFDTLLSLAASREDPTSGGRHKVFGSRALWVPPQTSTIASHLPKAVGWALGHERARRLGLPPVTDARAIACVSFGDASVNHAVALTAFNTAAWAVRHGLPVPVLFVCEDNGLGISVRTPRGWVHDRLGGVDWLDYRVADGLDLAAAHDAAAGAVEACRRTRRPVFLHLEVVRLLGHAGSDVEQGYRAEAEILADEARDPVRATARLLVAEGWLSAPEALEVYEEARARVDRASREAGRRPRLATAEEVMAPLAPRGPGRPDRVRAEAERTDYHAARVAAFGGEALLPERHGRGRHLAMLLNWGLADLMARYPEACVFGEDVAAKGGVYHVTTGLRERFGAARVFDTLLDETSILGLAVGFAQAGLLPIPEIQYLAYVHNAEDQLRGEACSLGFFSAGQFANPMVVRIASFAYQKGFGGHFHNDNSVAALRDVPGLVLAVPSRGDDAVGMLRTLAALARVEGRVGVLLEPIALYMTKDLHEKG